MRKEYWRADTVKKAWERALVTGYLEQGCPEKKAPTHAGSLPWSTSI